MSDPVKLSVALVEAPFGPAIWPSIGTSLLKAELQVRGHRASVLYVNHLLLEMMGPASQATLSIYQDVSDAFGTHLGEWIFVDEAFPDQSSAARDEEYIALLTKHGTAPGLIEAACKLRAQAGQFLNLALERFDWLAFDVVGFANTFSQLNASIALARRLRERFPDLPFIAGGSGCSDDMGVGVAGTSNLFRAVALGEADEIIADLCEAVASGDDAILAKVPGIAFRSKDGSVTSSPPKERVTQMNDLPIPQFDDYYITLPAAYRPQLPFYLPIEASRGCWWGAKHHCVFCGLNPDRMAHYAKSPERFLSEVEFLSERYAPPRFMAVDNIMPREFYDDVVPRLRSSAGGAEFFFEVKANFRAEQLAAFSKGGVTQVQPGIESLSTHVLALMKKGITGPANILTLRLCEELGVRAHWSILYGFFGETADDYRGMAEIARRLFHLRPPLGLYRAEVERFAPMFRFPEENGLTNLRPSHWYKYCYPVEPDVLDKLAYRFDADRLGRDPELDHATFVELAGVVSAWREAYTTRTSALTLRTDGRRGIVERSVKGVRLRYHLSSAAFDIYQLFESPHKPTAIAGMGSEWGDTPYLDQDFASECPIGVGHMDDVQIDSADPAQIYRHLLVHGLIVQEGGLAVSVARRAGHSTLQNALQEAMAS